ncbi:MAG: ECF transporter S component, partial [Bacilli bacterium]
MRNKTIDRLTLNAFIIALISVMSMVPQVGYLGAGNISITTIHVVVLLFALLFGIREGAVAGLTFGVLSFIRAVILPSSPIDVLFINPLVSILPRVIFGIAAGATFDALRKIQMSKSLRTALTLIALPILTLFHSLITLSTLWIVYHNNELLASFNYWILLSSIFAVNGLLEILISLALTPALAFGIYRGIKSLNFLPLKEELLMTKTQTKFKTLTSPYLEEAIEKIGALVAFDSTYDEATVDEQNPYGKKVTAALKAVEKMAMDDGFEVTNYGNKVVEILYGKGEKNVTILAHADVVPASGEWTSDPYKLRRTKTHLYARGVADDKGPFVASYMALKALRESGMITDYQVRLLVG